MFCHLNLLKFILSDSFLFLCLLSLSRDEGSILSFMFRYHRFDLISWSTEWLNNKFPWKKKKIRFSTTSGDFFTKISLSNHFPEPRIKHSFYNPGLCYLTMLGVGSASEYSSLKRRYINLCNE